MIWQAIGNVGAAALICILVVLIYDFVRKKFK